LTARSEYEKKSKKKGEITLVYIRKIVLAYIELDSVKVVGKSASETFHGVFWPSNVASTMPNDHSLGPIA